MGHEHLMSTLQWNLPLSRAAIAAECNQSARVENGAHKDNDKRPLGNTTPDACAHTGSCNPIFQRCTFHLTFQIFACEPNSERAQTIAIPFFAQGFARVLQESASQDVPNSPSPTLIEPRPLGSRLRPRTANVERKEIEYRSSGYLFSSPV